METIMMVWNWIISNVEQLLQIVGAFAIIATMTKNKTDNKIAQMLLDVINFVAMNFGKASNDPNKL